MSIERVASKHPRELVPVQKVSKHAPADIGQWMAAHKFTFALTATLYEVSVESDRLIRAGHLRDSDAARRIADWALAKLAVFKDFNEHDWTIFLRATRFDEGTVATDNMLYMFLFKVIGPAVGGGLAYRKTEAEKTVLIKRASKLAEELHEVISQSIDMDIRLRELGAIDSGLQPLIDFSDELSRGHSRRNPPKTAEHAGDSNSRPQMKNEKEFSTYIEPGLFHFLIALRLRLAGKLPKPAPKVSTELASMLEEICPEDLKRIGDLVGLSGLGQPPQPAAPRFMQRGEFGKYPSQKKALRKAVILELARELCPPVYERRDPQNPQPKRKNMLRSFLDVSDHGKLIKFSRADMLEKISRAWFGDAPDIKEINSMILPYRHGKRGLGVAAKPPHAGKVALKND